MVKWYIKELSKLTNVSVQTLHYYDHIGLLKPSLRCANGYRLYSEDDLLKLQQIIALKFFGFKLQQIKILLSNSENIKEHFAAQSDFLQRKGTAMLEASQILKKMIANCHKDQFIPWKKMIRLIEVYQMTEKFKKTWVGQVLTPEELKHYAKYEATLAVKLTASEKKYFEEAWVNLIAKVHANLNNDPESKEGYMLAEQIMNLSNQKYSKDNKYLRYSIWEKGYKIGKVDGHEYLAPEIVEWIDKAVNAYYRSRIHSILGKFGTAPEHEILEEWNELLNEMYGDAEELKDKVLKRTLEDEKINVAAKNWLKEIYKL